MELLELLIHYDHDKLDLFIDLAIKDSLNYENMIMRDDSSGTKVLIKIVQIFLDPLFEKFYDSEDLETSIILISLNAPKMLRRILHTLFSKMNERKENLGYQALLALVVFRYFISEKILPHNLGNVSLKETCKTITRNKICIEKSTPAGDTTYIDLVGGDPKFLSLVSILTDIHIGGIYDYKLRSHNINNKFLLIHEFLKANTNDQETNKCLSEIEHYFNSVPLLKIKNLRGRSNSLAQIDYPLINKSTLLISPLISPRKNSPTINNPIDNGIQSVIKMFHDIGLKNYDADIRGNNWTRDRFLRFTNEDLKEMGIKKKGDREKLIKAIAHAKGL